jgi:hypothetical protein
MMQTGYGSRIWLQKIELVTAKLQEEYPLVMTNIAMENSRL